MSLEGRGVGIGGRLFRVEEERDDCNSAIPQHSIALESHRTAERLNTRFQSVPIHFNNFYISRCQILDGSFDELRPPWPSFLRKSCGRGSPCRAHRRRRPSRRRFERRGESSPHHQDNQPEKLVSPARPSGTPRESQLTTKGMQKG